MSKLSSPVDRCVLRWRYLVTAYGVISLVRLIADAYSAVVWQLLACSKPCCYTWPACRYLLCCPAKMGVILLHVCELATHNKVKIAMCQPVPNFLRYVAPLWPDYRLTYLHHLHLLHRRNLGSTPVGVRCFFHLVPFGNVSCAE